MTGEREDLSEADLAEWEPGAEGKGMLVRDAGDELTVHIWTVNGEGWPFHYHGERLLRPKDASVLCFFLVDPDGVLTVFEDELSGGETYTTMISGLDQRLSEGPDGALDFAGWAQGGAVRSAAIAEVASPLVMEELDEALIGAASLAWELDLPPDVLHGVAEASALLPIPPDPGMSWLARSVAWNSLQRFTLALPPSAGERWHEIVAEQVRPAADRVHRALIQGELLPSQIAADLEASHPRLMGAWYRGDQRGVTWPLMEALVRLGYVHLRLEQLKDSDPPVGRSIPPLIATLNRDMNDLRNLIVSALEQPDSVPRTLVVNHAIALATGHEAVADGLVQPRSAEVLRDIYADGYAVRNQAAVRAAVGRVSAVPIVVASSDRWLAERFAGGQWPERPPLGLYKEAHSILLSRSAGETAATRKAAGLLDKVVVHELVHATQRPREGALQRPPYGNRALACEAKICEALTDYFTDRILAQARSEWQGPGPNPYDAPDMERRAYAGYIAVMLAAMEVATGGEPDALLREMARSPHKLSLLTELLTGSYSRERKEALIETLEPLLALGEGVALPLRSLDADLRDLATEEIERYRLRFA